MACVGFGAAALSGLASGLVFGRSMARIVSSSLGSVMFELDRIIIGGPIVLGSSQDVVAMTSHRSGDIVAQIQR